MDNDNRDGTIKSVSEYINKIKNLLRDNYTNNNIRLYFRGEDRKYVCKENEEIVDTRCIPKCFRYGNERDEFFKYMRRYPEEFTDMSNLERLAKMQHFGAPTRLLDITTNPLVALFFACGGFSRINSHLHLKERRVKFKNNNGHVYVFLAASNDDGNTKRNILAPDSDRGLLLSNLAKMSIEEKINIHKFACSKIEPITPDQVVIDYDIDSKDIQNQKRAFSKYIYECERERDAFSNHHVNPRDLEDIFFIKPAFNNSRMKQQSSLFIIFGNKYEKDKIDINYFRNKIVMQKDTDLQIVIDEKSKDKILGELKVLCGISYSSLFDDLVSAVEEPKNELFSWFLKSYK